ncbi:transcriptional regulator [Streptomyces mirabilis]|uniref:transcriptional regulator n=1 Tax=Streptomyces mirabilis TaxID=68239 RepID=UPI0037A26D6B
MTDSTHHDLSRPNASQYNGVVLSYAQLPSAATDLILLGDLTGRYATGSYSRLASDGRSLVLRENRQGAAEHGHRITAAIACHVARAGGSIDQLTQLLLHPEHEGGRHTRHIALRSGQSRALGYIRRVWASASDAISSTRALGSRHEAYEVLAALRDRIETTPWRGERGRTALRVLRAHLNFAEIAGGPLHHASERQTAEEAGVPARHCGSSTRRCSGRVAGCAVCGWVMAGRAPPGTWATATSRVTVARLCCLVSGPLSSPPDPALGEWTTSETATTADIDSTVLGRLMGHDAFAHHALGSAALVIISALHVRRDQTVAELVGTSSVSRATTYRTLKRLADHGLVQHTGETWALAPRALEGFGIRPPDADNGHTPALAQGWDKVAKQHGTWGVAAQRKALHTAERAAYQEALGRFGEHRSRAVVIVRAGRQVLVPVPRPDEIPPAWHAPDGRVLDPVTGRPAADWRVATDGRLILITPSDQRSYDELAAAHAEALSEWESVA